VYFINTINTHSVALPGSSANTGSYYGLYLNAGTVSLTDSAGVSAFGFYGAIDFDSITPGTAAYKARVTETVAIATYTEGTLAANTDYYFTVTQLIPSVSGNTNLSARVRFNSGSVTTANSVATGLGAELLKLQGFKLASATASGGVLTITAAAGFPILFLSGVDSVGTIALSTPGVQSFGYNTDMVNAGWSTYAGYSSGNTYDQFKVTYKRTINDQQVVSQAIVFINHADANLTNLKNALTSGNATSVFNFHALASTDGISANVVDKQ
jgi:hypothetical protein